MTKEGAQESINPTQKRLLTETRQALERLSNDLGGNLTIGAPRFSSGERTIWEYYFPITFVIAGERYDIRLRVEIIVDCMELDRDYPWFFFCVFWDTDTLEGVLSHSNVRDLDGDCFQVLGDIARQEYGVVEWASDQAIELDFGRRWFGNHQEANDMASMLEEYILRIQIDLRSKWQETISTIKNA